MSTRIALPALLIAAGVVILRAPVADLPPPAANPGKPGDANEAVAWLMVLVVPALALLIYAGLRYRPRRSPAATGDGKRPSWRAGVLALAALVGIAVGLALLGRLLPRRADPDGAARHAEDSSRGAEPESGGRPEMPEGGQGLDIDTWTIFTLAALGVLVIMSVIVHRRPAAGEPDVPDGEPVAGSVRQEPLATATRRALSVVDSPDLDARQAIIRCYAAMEHALREAPGAAPEPADTPSEVLRRAADAGQLRAEHGERLVKLFTEARYSSHAMSAGDRTAASATLRLILDELRRPAWTRS